MQGLLNLLVWFNPVKVTEINTSNILDMKPTANMKLLYQKVCVEIVLAVSVTVI